MARVTILNRAIDLESCGETILDTALDSGIDYPHGCRNGTCGTCKTRLLDGDVDIMDFAPEALSEEERQVGLILACRAKPKSDIRVEWTAEDFDALPPVKKLKGTVVDIKEIAEALHHVRIEPDGGPMQFLAGQYADVQFGDHPPRSFSMANRPDETVLEFVIRHMPDGLASHHVATELKVGDSVRLKGPYGDAYWRAKDLPIIAVAGGSGIAPIRSIVRTALQLGHRQSIHMYLGVRDEPSSGVIKEFQRIADLNNNFRFDPVLSTPREVTERRVGHVHEAVGQDYSCFDGQVIYCAGPPVMVDAMSELAKAKGADTGSIFADRFEPAKTTAKSGLFGRLFSFGR